MMKHTSTIQIRFKSFNRNLNSRSDKKHITASIKTVTAPNFAEKMELKEGKE